MTKLRIKCFREKKNYSLSELAKKSGVSKSYLSQIERNLQINPSLQLLSKLAKTLDCSVDELLGQDSSQVSTVEHLDPDWTELVKEAIVEGLSKEEFKELSEFIRYRNLKQNNSNIQSTKIRK
jgi:XRE family transcriptional regulator, master regulator for biofilm formation